MGRRKNSNDNNMNQSSHSHHSHNSKIRLDDPEEETTQCSNNIDESMCDPECSDKAINEPNDVSFMDGDDKTSADYYFDSYSHFGIHEVSEFNIDDGLAPIWLTWQKRLLKQMDFLMLKLF
nr:protein arginine n-methyltransferase 1.1 [Quercus suber]